MFIRPDDDMAKKKVLSPANKVSGRVKENMCEVETHSQLRAKDESDVIKIGSSWVCSYQS